MIEYILIRPDGSIFQRASCREEAEIPVIDGIKSEIVTAQDPRRPQSVNQATYADYRKMDYPGIGSQLDSLWHAMNNGVLPKVEPFYTQILEVKARYPKP